MKISAAVFTNLTQDHLDYHKDMRTYFKAKARLFSELLSANGTAVLNFDSSEFEALKSICISRGVSVISFGSSNGADIQLLDVKPSPTFQEIRIKVFKAEYQFVLKLLGKFQILNVLAALGIVVASQKDSDVEFWVDQLRNLKGVPGRLERVTASNSLAQVIVDYAHTPDALRNALVALRQHTSKRLICVFGAGGERDIGKRKIMGQVADELADLCVITDDNPRNENPKRIRDQILEGCPNGESIAGRGEAIKLGISKLQSGDLLLVAGKGHESTQEMKGQKFEFSDVEVIKNLIKNAEGLNHE